MTTEERATRFFLRELFAHDEAAGKFLLIWRLADKHSAWFSCDNLEGAVQYVLSNTDKDVYVGVGLADEAFGPDKRCKAADVSALIGLWGDIDIAGPRHKKQNLPKSIEDARKILNELPFKPSILVHSGNGLHAWWLFQEPWILDTPEEKERAAAVCRRWNGLISDKARQLGYEVDSVHDLSRVLRVPGSMNFKDISSPKPVQIVADRSGENSYRIDPDVIEGFLPEELPREALPAVAEVGKLILLPSGEPPAMKFMSLCNAYPKFMSSWQRTRTDMKDTSPSAWDLSLATIAAGAGWSDQEIANLCIASRRENKDDLKLRQDYYQNTVKKAREGLIADGIRKAALHVKILVEKGYDDQRIAAEVEERFPDMNYSVERIQEFRAGLEKKTEESQMATALKAVTEADPHYEEKIPPDMSKDDRSALIRKGLSVALGLDILRVIKYTGEPPTYRLELADISVPLGEIRNLVMQGYFRQRIAEGIDDLPNRISKKKWDTTSRQLLQVAVHEDPGEESRDVGRFKAWLHRYLEEYEPVPQDDEGTWKSAAIENMPLKYEDGSVFIPTSGFMKYVRKNESHRMTVKALSPTIRHAGGAPEQVSFRQDGRAITRRGWKVSNGLVSMAENPTGNEFEV